MDLLQNTPSNWRSSFRRRHSRPSGESYGPTGRTTSDRSIPATSPAISTISQGDQERLSLLHKSYEEWINSGLGMVEPIFYGGEGAYDFQYLEMASKTYAADEQWIQNHTGDNLDTFIEIFKVHYTISLGTPEGVYPGLAPEEVCTAVFSKMSFRLEDISTVSRHSLENFITTFSFIPGEANQEFRGIGDHNTTHSRPSNGSRRREILRSYHPVPT